MGFLNMLIEIIPGSISCFFGLKLQKIVLTIAWFVIGFFGLAFFLEYSSINETLQIILELATGIILGIFSLKIQKAAWFILLFVIGFLLIFLTTSDAWYFLVLASIVGLIFGIIAVYLYEPMIIVSTSLVGSYSIVVSITNMFTQNMAVSIISIIAFIILTLAGLYVQFSNYKKLKEKKAK